MTQQPPEGVRSWTGSMPETYERFLVPAVFAPFARDLGARVAGAAPRRVLELAAGTGVLTRELVGTGADVVATDLSPAMTAVGRIRVPQARWQVADATVLPFADAAFDAVACQFGVMFLPDKPAAFAEARRVLAPGGRLLVSTWGAVDDHGFQRAVTSAVARVLPVDPPSFLTAVPHGYRDPDAVAADLRAGGFTDVSVTRVTLTGTAPSASALAAGYCGGTPLRFALEQRFAEEGLGDLTDATRAVAQELTALLGDGPVTASMTAYVAASSS